MTERVSVRDEYDAVIELHPWNDLARRAFAVVKKTYTIGAAGLRPAPPIPLRHDLRDERYAKSWPTGSDFWPFKAATDVIVLGNAYAAGPRVRRRAVHVRVGRARKAAVVFGPRHAEVRGDRVLFSDPEPFESVPLDLANAYGGFDPRVTLPPPASLNALLQQAGDHPGAYPRNGIGRGYLVYEGPLEGPVALPSVEDPDDLLTPERLFAKTVSGWVDQPLPWTFGWTHALQFPRTFYLGMDHLAPLLEDAELPEARRGFMPAHWRSLRGLVMDGRAPEPVFHQEASAGMTFIDLAPGTEIELSGMHPERDVLGFVLPEPPTIDIDVEGSRARLPARLMHVVITPHEEQVQLTWVAVREPLPRAFMRGLHGRIPLRLSVDGDRPIEHETPEPVLSVVRRAIREGRLRPRGAPTVAPRADAPAPGELARPSSLVLAEAPLDVPTGRLTLVSVDWELVSPFGLRLERRYSSAHAWREGLLGRGFWLGVESAFVRRGQQLLYQTTDGEELRVADGELALGEEVCLSPALRVRRTAGDSLRVYREDGDRLDYGSVDGASGARLVSITSDEGQRAELRYDAQGRLARLVLPSGAALRFEHEGARLVRVLAPAAEGPGPVLARYVYDAAGRLESAFDAAGREHAYGYDAEGRLVRHRPPGGPTFELVYAASRRGPRCTEVLRDGQRLVELALAEARDLLVVVDAEGLASLVTLDAAGRVRAVTDALGHRTEHEHVDAGWSVHVDALGRRVERDLDAGGRVLEEREPSGSVTSYVYGAGHVVRRVGPDGVRRWAYDREGRLAATATPGRGSTVYEHGPSGELTSMVVPPEVGVRLEHDAALYPTLVRGPTGERAVRYDPLGRIASVRDELGGATDLRYAPDGAVRELVWPTGDRLFLERDASRAVTRVDDGVVCRSLLRDSAGRALAVQAGASTLTIRRDGAGRIRALAASTGACFELELDGVGRLAREIAPDGASVVHARDPVGRTTSTVSATGGRLDVERDASGLVTAIRGAGGHVAQYAHDAAGWLYAAGIGETAVAFARDAVGHIVRERSQDAEIESLVGGDGRRIGWRLEGLAVLVERDALGAARGVRWHGRASGAIELARDALGRERGRRAGRLEIQMAHDGLGRRTHHRIAAPGHVIDAYYAWRGHASLHRTATPFDGHAELEHDARGALVAIRGDSGRVASRAVDELGRVLCGGATYDGERLTSSEAARYAYDATGRRVERVGVDGTSTRYGYDAMGRLAWVEKAGHRVRLVRDALGRWVRRLGERREGDGWVVTSERRFIWDGLTLLREQEGGDIVDWIWVDGELVARVDAARSVAIVVEPNGAVSAAVGLDGELAWLGGVDSFGRGGALVSGVEQPWRWCGHWHDEVTGLSYSLLRTYDPEAGCYLEPSPLGAAAGLGLHAPRLDPCSGSSPLGLADGVDGDFGHEVAPSFSSEWTSHLVRQLDREDGAAGSSTATRTPEPHELVLGPWARFHPRRARAGACPWERP